MDAAPQGKPTTSNEADNSALPPPPLTYSHINKNGLYEIVNLHTGEILCVQSSPTDEFMNKKWGNLTQITTADNQTVWIERGIDPLKVNLTSKFRYSLGWADLLAHYMVTPPYGTLTKACESLGLPYHIVSRWRRENPPFADILHQASKDRAELFHDELIRTSQNTTDETTSVDKLKIDTLKWAAEKADPERFGKKEQPQVASQVTTFIIQTGVPRTVQSMEDYKDAIEQASPMKIDNELSSELDAIPLIGEFTGASEEA